VNEAPKNNRRKGTRPEGSISAPTDLVDNALCSIVYILAGRESAQEKRELTGLLNETTDAGCSILVRLSPENNLAVGTECLVKLGDNQRVRAVLRWRRPFSPETLKLGFQFKRPNED